MDYLVGFILGLLFKEISTFLKNLNNYDWENRNTFKQAYYWSDYDEEWSEEDLP
jgi:hypothetical protein|tara:strand:- start:6106 stop:6267 length:162 start_codon:yes stop_codon:yes gene_type:complete